MRRALVAATLALGALLLAATPAEACLPYTFGDDEWIALPAYDHWHAPPRPLAATLEHLSNDSVAVWVLTGERIASEGVGAAR